MTRLRTLTLYAMSLLFLTVAPLAGDAIAQTAKQYKAVGFNPSPDRHSLTETARAELESLINSQAADGWEFVGVQNHSVVVEGSPRLFGFWSTSPYQQTVSVVVFRK